MKAKIEKVEFNKEFESKFGTLYQFKVWYNGKMAYYSAKKKEQTKFIAGQECEFVEEERSTEKGSFWIVKPMTPKNAAWNKAIKKEQSRYSGFAVSYVKDLIIADKIELKDWEKASEKIFKLMVKLDKTLDQ
jgi:hypothetical protein